MVNRRIGAGKIALACALANALLAPPAHAATETVLHAFKGREDGGRPKAGLTEVDGTLYGTTNGGQFYGTIFRITPSCSEKVVHTFGSPNDGDHVWAGLLNVGGTLYGTTITGGANQTGTIYKYVPGGAETVIYQFPADGSGGVNPYASLIRVEGALYSTTSGGGGDSGCPSNGCGVVFKVTRAGKAAVLAPFGSGVHGEMPHGGLTNVGGMLYGVTASTSMGKYGAVYAVTTAGVMTTVYAFKGHRDAIATPLDFGSLIHIKTSIYGTTASGGDYGYGTVFKVSPTGREAVVYSFKGGSDGAEPTSGVIDVNGTLYGTTVTGGGTGCGGIGCGTVFQLTTAGDEQVIYAFAGGTDGQAPLAGLLNLNGTLYGTTNAGGGSKACADGCGTVFAVTP